MPLPVSPEAQLAKKLKYICNAIRREWKNKNWWKFHTLYYLAKAASIAKSNQGFFVMNDDWDNLIILDACRHDTFSEVIGKKVDYRISRGSDTPEFLKENFANKKFNDIVYVTANPWIHRVVKNSFYKVVPLWKFSWNDNLDTVTPDVMVDHATEIEKKYPNKKLIIHFMQPHSPYTLKDGTQWKKNPEKTYAAYKQNLENTIPYALELAEKLKGKTVITADHGEAFNDRLTPLPIRISGHPGYVHIPVLVKVPWFEIKATERKDIKEKDEKQKLKEQAVKLNEKI